MNVSRASGTPCGSSYGLFCIFIENKLKPVCTYCENRFWLKPVLLETGFWPNRFWAWIIDTGLNRTEPGPWWLERTAKVKTRWNHKTAQPHSLWWPAVVLNTGGAQQNIDFWRFWKFWKILENFQNRQKDIFDENTKTAIARATGRRRNSRDVHFVANRAAHLLSISANMHNIRKYTQIYKKQ